MKSYDDALPTLFGVIAIVGLLSWSHSGYWAETGLSPILLFGGVTSALIASLFSVINAKRGHKFSKIHTLNLFWALLSGLYLLNALNVLVNPPRFTF
jgi:hypothetical protein